MFGFNWLKTGFQVLGLSALIISLIISNSDAARVRRSAALTKTDQALAFLRSKIGPVGLLDSFVEDGADYSYTYDDAMAAMAFIAANDLTSAQRVLDAFIIIPPTPEGGFLHRYRATNGASAEGILGVGHNTYLLQAMNLYYQKTGDSRYNTVSQMIADYLISQQDSDGGLFGRIGALWKSTENNLGALSAIHNFGMVHNLPNYIDKAELIRTFITTECWNGTRFLTGKGDAMIVTDTQSLGAMILGPAFANGVSWIESQTRNTQSYASRKYVTGFDEDTNRDTVWTEGTLQVSMAFLTAGNTTKSNTYKTESEKLIQSSGALWQASNTGTTGFGDYFQKWQAVAPTAWYILVDLKNNVLGLL